MQKLEVETGQFTSKTPEPADIPDSYPVRMRGQCLYPAQLELLGVLRDLHGQVVFSQDLNPLPDRHCGDIILSRFMDFTNSLEEGWRIIG